jgi:membrane protease YdiL (CAAX protease family)
MAQATTTQLRVRAAEPVGIADTVPASSRRLVVALAWLSMLVSVAVYGFWRAVLPGDVDGLQLGQILFVAALLVATWVWSAIRPLRGYLAVLLAIHVVTNYLHPFLAGTAVWQTWFGTPGSSPWLVETLGDRLLKLGETLVVVGLLRALGTSRRAAFLTPGQLDAPAQRVRWLGMRAAEPWSRFGVKLALVLGAVFTAVLASMLPPSSDGLGRLILLLPLALLVAAMNALYEEVLFRAAPLSQLWRVVGARQAIFITAAYFGLGHFSGSIPSGPAGVLQAGFLGWLLSKSMLETHGLAWPWFLHFVLDAIIFCFLVAHVS